MELYTIQDEEKMFRDYTQRNKKELTGGRLINNNYRGQKTKIFHLQMAEIGQNRIKGTACKTSALLEERTETILTFYSVKGEEKTLKISNNCL